MMEQKQYELAAQVLREVQKVILGKREIVEKVLMAVLAQGHVLLDDVPGVGKTTLAMAFARALGLETRRVQFTPDTMPSDILGFSVYDKQAGAFSYQPGAVMTNLLLADEINRTSTKTQAALRLLKPNELETLRQMARGLAAQFGSNCEVVVHEISERSDRRVMRSAAAHQIRLSRPIGRASRPIRTARRRGDGCRARFPRCGRRASSPQVSCSSPGKASTSAALSPSVMAARTYSPPPCVSGESANASCSTAACPLNETGSRPVSPATRP